MHKNHIAHLDISTRNVLTDFKGHYAYIDFEQSRRFDGITSPRIPRGYRGTEVPPECENDLDETYDPYKVDIWALAVLIIRACKASIDIFLRSDVLTRGIAYRILCSRPLRPYQTDAR